MKLMTANSICKLIRTLLVLSVCTGLLATAYGQQSSPPTVSREQSAPRTPEKWDRYTIHAGEFSVLLPTVPAMMTYPISHSDKKWKSQQSNLIGAYSQGVVYKVQVFEVRQSFEDFINESGEASGLSLQREITVSNIRGKEYTSQDDFGNRIQQFFIIGKRVYIFGAMGSALGNRDTAMPRFFESIKFDQDSEALVIADGPGVQNPEAPPIEPDKVFTGKEVTVKARVFSKPEPNYTDDARLNKITGTVVLRAVFTSYGAVANISARSGLPHGLTEQAIAAARQLRFIPPIKDGRFVSMYIQLEYNFNLY